MITKKDVKTKKVNPIHRSAPKHEELATSTEMLVTGIKVVDLMEPYTKGRKNRLIWWSGCWKNCLIKN